MLDELEAELKEARLELAEYQALLQEFPAIYEDKFRQQVHSTAQDIRRLLDERKDLQEQLNKVLSQPAEAPRLAAAPEVQPDATQLRSRFEVSLPRFLMSLRSDSPSRASTAQSSDIPNRVLAPWRWAFLGGVALVGTALIGQVVFKPQGRPTAPVQKQERNGVQPIPSVLRLVARGGQSWVLIEDLSGRKLLDAILDNGEMRSIEINSGVKIRSGRPDLLYFGVDSQPSRRLGEVSDLDWTEIRPQV